MGQAEKRLLLGGVHVPTPSLTSPGCAYAVVLCWSLKPRAPDTGLEQQSPKGPSLKTPQKSSGVSPAQRDEGSIISKTLQSWQGSPSPPPPTGGHCAPREP